MELSEIIKGFISEISDEIKEEENMRNLNDDILRPIIKEVIKELYPYILRAVICLFIFLLAIIILIFLNIRVIYS